MRSTTVASKARDILTEGRIGLPLLARVYTITNATGASYHVTIATGYERCDCPAGTRQGACSHLLSARLLDAGLREELAPSPVSYIGPAAA